MKKRALVSVSNKENLIDFVRFLITQNYEIVSTGGTKKLLEEQNIPVISIDEITHFPEIMDGRVKTLHPNVHGGLLCVRDNENHIKALHDNNIDLIDMVVVNLYPFKETISKEGVAFEEAIENIDIGGPSMLRSAAKNHRFVTVLCDPADYALVRAEMEAVGEVTLPIRERLAAKTFRHTASYDATIAAYLTEQVEEQEPESVTLTYQRKQTLRYGENPHQSAVFYAGKPQGYSVAWSQQLQGKELSYNNIQDADAAVAILKEFKSCAVVAVKHKNPCGVGVGNNLNEAWKRCYEADSVSIFGGIVATNCEVDAETAKEMQQVFLEIVLAPSYTQEALEVFASKKNLRVLTFDTDTKAQESKIYTSVIGGMLEQSVDNFEVDNYNYTVVTQKQPTEEQLNNMLFAMKVCKHVKSNAITLVKDLKTVGIGGGQTNRVGAAHIALEQAKAAGHTSGIALASDAFFPFDDVVKLAQKYGVETIIQPGGSMRDQDSIKACDELGIVMIFTGVRHFKH